MLTFASSTPLKILIVGGNSGIGLEFVNHFLAYPNLNHLYATFHNRDSASNLISLSQKHSQKLSSLYMDITQESSIEDGISEIRKTTDQLHLVIYCVGLLHDEELQPEKSLNQISGDQLVTYFQVNSIGAVLIAKHILPLLKHSANSIFAAISAKVGSIEDNALGGWYGYRASKAALNMLLKTTAIEYGRKSPQTIVVALHPGTTDTKLSQPFQRNVPVGKLFSPEKTVTQLVQVLQGLGSEANGKFFSWDGTVIPW